MNKVTAGTQDGHLYMFGYTHTAHAWAGFLTRNIPKSLYPKKTVAVIGVPIGGTSVVSAVLDALGIMMGDQNRLRAGGAFEDPVFMTPDNEEERKATIKQRNEQYDIWGFKNPHGVAMLDTLHMFRNPYCIFVFRDPVAAACHYSHAHNLTVDEGLSQFHNETELLYQAMMKTTLPSLITSHERIKTTPEFFIQAIARFLGITPAVEQWVDALGRISSRGGYLQMPREFGPGPGNKPQ